MERDFKDKTLFAVQMISLGGLSLLLLLLAFHPNLDNSNRFEAGTGAFVGLLAFAKLIQDEIKLRKMKIDYIEIGLIILLILLFIAIQFLYAFTN